MNREDVPLEPMVENLTVKFTAKAQKPVRFTADLKAPMVYADKEYLEEVLSNLMDNAIKYSKPEGVDIRIRSELNEKYTVVKVHDNGLGISEARTCRSRTKEEQEQTFRLRLRVELRTTSDACPRRKGIRHQHRRRVHRICIIISKVIIQVTR